MFTILELELQHSGIELFDSNWFKRWTSFELNFLKSDAQSNQFAPTWANGFDSVDLVDLIDSIDSVD